MTTQCINLHRNRGRLGVIQTVILISDTKTSSPIYDRLRAICKIPEYIRTKSTDYDGYYRLIFRGNVWGFACLYHWIFDTKLSDASKHYIFSSNLTRNCDATYPICCLRHLCYSCPLPLYRVPAYSRLLKCHYLALQIACKPLQLTILVPDSSQLLSAIGASSPNYA